MVLKSNFFILKIYFEGKIYQDVISRERRGDYLGTTVQGFQTFFSNKSFYKTLRSTKHLINQYFIQLCLM